MRFWTTSQLERTKDDGAHCPISDRCLVSPACAMEDNGRHSDCVTYRRRHFDKGALIWCNDGANDRVFAVCTGMVTLFRCSEDGTETILGVLGSGQAFGHTGLFAFDAQSLIARACTAVDLCQFPIRDLERLVRSEPEVAERVIRSLVDSLWRAFTQIESLSTLRVQDRIKVLLRQMAEQLSGESGWFKLTLTHEDIACIVGANRVTVTRALKELEEEGSLQRGRRGTLLVAHQHSERNEEDISSVDAWEAVGGAVRR